MNHTYSLYLDLIRLCAASFIVYSHSNVRFLLPEVLPLAKFAHSAVTVFFVLSGYVVAFVTDQRERTPQEYVASRTARILPLAMVAVLATPLIDMLGRSFEPDIYSGLAPSDHILLRIGISLAFLCEIWTMSVMTFINVPYWSLCYEVWYYTIFGVHHFASQRYRTILIVGICLLIGPKILLMAPAWLAGVWIYRWRKPDQLLPTAYAVLAWLTSILLFVLYHVFDIMRAFSGLIEQYGGDWLHEHLTFSKYFGADWLLAAVVAINFVCARIIAERINYTPSRGLTHACNRLGGLSYALYILHFPLLYCIGSLLYQIPPSTEKWLITLSATLTICLACGVLAECLRPRFRAFLLRSIHPHSAAPKRMVS